MSVVPVTLNPCIDEIFSVERVVPERKLTGRNAREYPGGGGINVARVISRLGGDVRALWSCGGHIGRRLEELLDAEGVPHTPITIAGDVRVNLIITDESSGEQYRFNMPGPELDEGERAEWVRALQQLSHAVRYVVFSGSLPGRAPLGWFGQLLEAAPKDALVVVDTKGDALRLAVESGVYLIKPNARELADLVGRELDDDEELERAARELIDHGGTEVVLVSLGRGGALLVTSNETQRLSAPSVRIRSKVGAGDSMVGALVYALGQGRPLDEAARLGVAAGAAAVMTEGTELCHREDVVRLHRSVRRQEVA